MKFEWDEAKRESNLAKHGVDFVDAAKLLEGNALVGISSTQVTMRSVTSLLAK